MSFSDGGGEPSTQPFQPFLAACRFFLGGLATWSGCGDMVPTLRPRSVKLSPSSGVWGLFDDAVEVAEEREGSGVLGGDEGGIGGGVTELERCPVMLIDGRACQKDDVVEGVTRGAGTGWGRFAGLEEEATVEATATWGLSGAMESDFARFLSCSCCFSRSFFSFLRALRSSSISAFSTESYTGTPFNTLVSTSREGRGSKSPARTEVAVRRRLNVYAEYMGAEGAMAMHFVREETKDGSRRGVEVLGHL